MNIYFSSGVLNYSDNPKKLVLLVDQQLSDYYFYQVKKFNQVNRQKYPPHISVVRQVIPSNIQYWNKYQDKVIHFSYESVIYNDELYYWIHCFSNELEEIRLELGLSKSGDSTLSPDGRHKFHMTICNVKK